MADTCSIDWDSFTKISKEPEVVDFSTNDKEGNEENNGKQCGHSNRDFTERRNIGNRAYAGDFAGAVTKGYIDLGNFNKKNGNKEGKKSDPILADHSRGDYKNVARIGYSRYGGPGYGAGADSDSLNKLRKEPPEVVSFSSKDLVVFDEKNGNKGGDYKKNTRSGNQLAYDGRKRQTRNSDASGGNRYDFGGHDGKGPSRNSKTEITPIIDWEAFNRKAAEATKARWAKCPKLTKDFYKEKPEVANLPTEVVERMRMNNNNTMVSLAFEQKVGGEVQKIPNPIWTFEQCFDAYPDLMAEITKQGFKKPSPIQYQAWPILLKGNDMIGIAQTGTGKTLAFLLPAMIHTEYQSIPRGERGGPNVLVLAPFRSRPSVCIYGGGDRRLQIRSVKRGVEIIVCTPGRLNDLVQANVIDLSTVTFLILDEADRMLDMGFEPQIRKVMLDIRPDRQTVMTSATWPSSVRRLAKSYMDNPIQVCVGSLDLAATHSVTQIIKIMADDEEKYRSIKNCISKMKPNDKAIVFCGLRGRADDLSSDLSIDGFMTACIHDNREQRDREQAIADIKTGRVKLMVATDVAARGLDIEDITYVINYDFPRTIEEYVHRVGRTGRAGRTGISISYLTRDDWVMAQELIKILEEAGQEVPDELRDMSRRYAAKKEKRCNSFGGGNRQHGYGNGNNNCFRS